MKYFLTCLILLPLFSCGQQLSDSEIKTDRDIIKNALNDKTGKSVCVEKVVPDKATAVAIAEPILFNVYGKDQILHERPYVVNFVDGYWVLSGSLPKGWWGGTFLIVVSAKDGRVIRLIHYK
jgi:hypothetical protein